MVRIKYESEKTKKDVFIISFHQNLALTTSTYILRICRDSISRPIYLYLSSKSIYLYLSSKGVADLCILIFFFNVKRIKIWVFALKDKTLISQLMFNSLSINNLVMLWEMIGHKIQIWFSWLNNFFLLGMGFSLDSDIILKFKFGSKHFFW